MATEINWRSEVEPALKEAKANRKRVLLDFSHAPYFQTIVDRSGTSDAVPEALYFLGVCKNRIAGGTADARRAIWKRLMDEHPKSDWAKKASFAFE